MRGVVSKWYQPSTDAQRDQDHLEMITYNCPGIPDRTSYILGESRENPVRDMIRIGKELAVQGAACISIPCITAHYFHFFFRNMYFNPHIL